MMEAMPDSGEQSDLVDEFDMAHDRWCELFADVAVGEAGALERLYDVAANRLYGFAVWATGSREDAEDVVSDVFVRIARQGARLSGVREPRAWLLTVTRRIAIDRARRASRRATERLEEAELVVAPAHDPGRARDAERASRLIAALPRSQREVVWLRHYADCTFSAIGTILGVPTFTAASRHRLAIRRLRRLMEAES
jgi:RNA polymerase sigma-70 factor (ECF subfamily)